MTDSQCIFCRIIRGELPARMVYSDEHVCAFHDINPVAPVHVLIVPRKHIISLHHLEEEDRDVMGHLIWVASRLARELSVAPDANMEGGFRLVVNTGRNAGQSVFHIHFHLIGGRKMTWPPG